MKLTVIANDELRFPLLDEVLGDAVNPFWDSITKIYRGSDAPVDQAVKRYFTGLRPIRIIPSFPSRVMRSDLILVLSPRIQNTIHLLDTIHFKKQHHLQRTPVIIYYPYTPISLEEEDNDCPF